MGPFLAVVIAVSLVIILAITVFILVRRKRRLSTPGARYQRDIRGIQMARHIQTKPRPGRQLGADGLEGKYPGGGMGGV
jgi:hypothetical protein